MSNREENPQATSSRQGRSAGCDSSDAAEMAGFYVRMRKSLMRYASRYFKQPQEIEDIVQEAFVKVLEERSRRNIQVSDAYLYRTTHNLALNILDRSDYKLTDTVGDLLPESVLLKSASLEDEFESRERFELFCRCVRQLPRKCQRAFILRRVYGLSHREIAERMGISVKTVEIHVAKALVRCTDLMDAEENNTSQPQVAKPARGAGS